MPFAHPLCADHMTLRPYFGDKAKKEKPERDGSRLRKENGRLEAASVKWGIDRALVCWQYSTYKSTW